MVGSENKLGQPESWHLREVCRAGLAPYSWFCPLAHPAALPPDPIPSPGPYRAQQALGLLDGPVAAQEPNEHHHSTHGNKDVPSAELYPDAQHAAQRPHQASLALPVAAAPWVMPDCPRRHVCLDTPRGCLSLQSFVLSCFVLRSSHSPEGKRADSGVSLPRFKFCLCHLVAAIFFSLSGSLRDENTLCQ